MSTHAIVPHTRIDNSIIDDLASKIGIYGLGIYVAIKRHLNTKTGDCFPSYQTIAKKLHIDRGTVIRYVKKLKAFNLTPFNIGIAGRAARTSPIDRCFCL
jgi:hypothetical protein